MLTPVVTFPIFLLPSPRHAPHCKASFVGALWCRLGRPTPKRAAHGTDAAVKSLWHPRNIFGKEEARSVERPVLGYTSERRQTVGKDCRWGS
jgi:hypothetical protein